MSGSNGDGGSQQDGSFIKAVIIVIVTLSFIAFAGAMLGHFWTDLAAAGWKLGGEIIN